MTQDLLAPAYRDEMHSEIGQELASYVSPGLVAASLLVVLGAEAGYLPSNLDLPAFLCFLAGAVALVFLQRAYRLALALLLAGTGPQKAASS